MRAPARVLPFVLALVVGPAAPVAAETHEVVIIDVPPSFNPQTTSAVVGDDVHWTKPIATPIQHNVVQVRGLFVSGPPSGGPIDYTVTFSAGRFPYYCDVHGSSDGGMVGTVAAAPVMNRGPEGLPFRVRWASPATETGSAFDVRFRVGDGDWRTWKTDARRFVGTFGLNRSPVRVREGRRYAFQARSQLDAGTGGAVSRWSPSLVVET